MGPTQTIRPTFSRVLAVAVAGCALLALGLVGAQAGPLAALRLLPPLAVVVLLAWAVLWRPLVEVSDGGVLLVNPWRTVHVPWPALREVDEKWSLTVRTTDGRAFTAYAAPAPGAVGSDRLGLSGAAAAAVHDRRERLERAGYLTEVKPEGAPVTVRAHLRTLAGRGVLLAASAVSLLLPG